MKLTTDQKHSLWAGLTILVLILPSLSFPVSDHLAQARYEKAGEPIPPGFKASGSFSVEAVFMHEPGSYSVAVRHGDKLDMVRLNGAWDYPPAWSNSTTVLRQDAKVGEPIQVEFRNVLTHRREDHPEVETTYVIHLHDAHELRGADWNHGKFGHGTTQVIEAYPTVYFFPQ